MRNQGWGLSPAPSGFSLLQEYLLRPEHARRRIILPSVHRGRYSLARIRGGPWPLPDQFC